MIKIIYLFATRFFNSSFCLFILKCWCNTKLSKRVIQVEVTLGSNCKDFIHPGFRLSGGYLLLLLNELYFLFALAHDLSSAGQHTNRIASFSPPRRRSDSKGAPDGAGTSVELIAGRTMSRWPVAGWRANDRCVELDSTDYTGFL